MGKAQISGWNYLTLPPPHAYYVPGHGITELSNYYIEGIRVGGGCKVVEYGPWNKSKNIEELAELGVVKVKI